MDTTWHSPYTGKVRKEGVGMTVADLEARFRWRSHDYDGQERGRCRYKCGAVVSSSWSDAPGEIDPFGVCPNSPVEPRASILEDLHLGTVRPTSGATAFARDPSPESFAIWVETELSEASVADEAEKLWRASRLALRHVELRPRDALTWAALAHTLDQALAPGRAGPPFVLADEEAPLGARVRLAFGSLVLDLAAEDQARFGYARRRTYRHGETLIDLVLGDITRETTDVIVNAANSSLAGGGGVDGALRRAGGPEIAAACADLRAQGVTCPPGSAVVTTGGQLKCHFLIHAVGPVWREGDADQEEVLRRAYGECIRLALDVGARSIAFPSISTGAFGYPVKDAARIALSQIRNMVPKRGRLQVVRFVLFSDGDFDAYAAALPA